jgi:hypothetical protein
MLVVPASGNPKSKRPRVKIAGPQDFIILEVSETHTTRYEIRNQLQDYHYVQPLPQSEFLLVSARITYQRRQDLNARVFSTDGQQKREFLLGDGIEDVQTTSDGYIWTSYFDEGVLGNHGWSTPIGHQGLIQWNSQGEQTYQYWSPSGLEPVFDCYALNVISNEDTWFYYNPSFPLVHLHNHRVANYWYIPVGYSHVFAVWKSHALFYGNYKAPDTLYLVSLSKDHTAEVLNTYTLAEAPKWITARGTRVVYLIDDQCYLIDLKDLPS